MKQEELSKPVKNVDLDLVCSKLLNYTEDEEGTMTETNDLDEVVNVSIRKANRGSASSCERYCSVRKRCY